jgi:hypothetical protein
MMLLASAAHAAGDVTPASTEVIGWLDGRPYTYGEFSAPSPCIPFNPSACLAPRLRWDAALMFRDIVVRETVRSMLRCDSSASDTDISEFVEWWRSAVEIEDKPYPLRKSRALEITTNNVQVTEAAKDAIGTWKERDCLYRAYGGGHVQKPVPPLSFTMTFYRHAMLDHASPLPGLPNVQPGIPHDAYRAHFHKLMELGKLRFADQVYEDAFFWLDRDFAFQYYKAAEEADAVLVPYWKKAAPVR